MENFRSMSCREGRATKNGGNGDQQNRTTSGYPPNMQDLRSFSTSYAPSSSANNDLKVEKNQNQSSEDYTSGRRSTSSSFGGGWSFVDPELQRKRRVASYKVYGVEGKMKGSIRKSFKWIKNTCSQVAHAWR